LLRRLFRCLTAAALSSLVSLLLNKAVPTAFQKLLLADPPVIIGVDHLEIDDERSGLVLREKVSPWRSVKSRQTRSLSRPERCCARPERLQEQPPRTASSREISRPDKAPGRGQQR
jgi:hypothetical protein